MPSPILYRFLLLSTSAALATPKQVYGNVDVDNYARPNISRRSTRLFGELSTIDKRDPSYNVAAQVKGVNAE
jgi:hypothetical protein